MESAEATALLGPRGSLDTASDTVVPGCCNCGTLDAESARCIAAAEGCVESVLDSAGALSFRSGDVLRDVRGLCPAAGEDVAGGSVVDEDFLNVDTDPPDDAPEDDGDFFVSFFVPLAFAPLPVGSAVSGWPLRDRKSAMLSSLLVIVVVWVRGSMLQL